MTARVLLVVNHAGFFLSHRLPIALAARAAGYEVHVATPKSRHSPQIEQHGLSWHPIEMTRSGRNPLSELRSIRSLTRLYRSLRPDLVHQVTTKPVIYGTIAARWARVPAVVNAVAGLGHSFGEAGLALRLVVRAGFRFALRHPNMRVILQNRDNREVFLQNGWLTQEQTVLIPGSGVDMKEFHPDGQREGLPLVVLPSRMIYAKGIADFVEAARMLKERGVAARFALVGESDPDNPGSIEESLLQRWGAEGVVEYWGRRDSMPAVYREAAIVALPTWYNEGVPKTLIEAAASGLPSVTTDAPGCRDIVRHEENGLLVPPRDPAALAAALQRLIEDAPLRARLGARGREIAQDEFSVDRVVQGTLALYAELLAS
jgi:glycosyltransferase involved in cell wall biosynthesis